MNEELILALNRTSKYLWDSKLKAMGRQNGGNVFVCFLPDLGVVVDLSIQNFSRAPFLVFCAQQDDLPFMFSGIKYIRIPVKIDQIIEEFELATNEIEYTEKEHGYTYMQYLSTMKRRATYHK